jgi:hypothetical protein
MMSVPGFKHMIPIFERFKTLRALDLMAIWIELIYNSPQKFS